MFHSNNSFSQPKEKWIFTAESQLYVPPLVADVCEEPGNEIIISDSEVRTLRCISASGKQIWKLDHTWKKRLTSAAALTNKTPDGKPLLLIGNGDGSLTCINAEKGKVVWQRNAGRIEWGNAIWVDLNGDGIDEAVAGTIDSGIVAYSIDGTKLWGYKGGNDRPVLSLKTPIAAADIDGDNLYEIFAVDRIGAVCLNNDGTLRWDKQTGDEFESAPVIADADLDGLPELYCASFDDNAIYAMDARSGDILWKFNMLNGIHLYSGSSIAVGDIDGDGPAEIVISDKEGYIYCLDASGKQRWIYATQKRTNASATMGDVDGDNQVEVLVSSDDHTLYCLDSYGFPEWFYSAELRLNYPPTISDVDLDGKTDILICGSDSKLRCLTLDGKYDPAKIPWASRRFNAAQSGSSYNQNRGKVIKIINKKELLLYGDFDQAKLTGNEDKYPTGSINFQLRRNRPRGWFTNTTTDAQWELDDVTKYSGKSSVKIIANGEFRLASEQIPVNKNLLSVNADIRLKGDKGEKSAFLVWIGLDGLIREDLLNIMKTNGEGWTQFSLSEIKPPANARWMQLVCVTNSSDTVWCDDAHLTGLFNQEQNSKVFVNQLGYEKNAPKWFTVQSNFKADSAFFQIINENGKVVFKSDLVFRDRIKGAFGNDWGSYYWRGDFSEITQPGKYRIKIVLDEQTDTSWPFEIASDLFWEKTARQAYRFFYYQRCGMEVPGFHKACHLDDATDEAHHEQFNLSGGWHDAGDYNKYHNAPYVFGLAEAYTVQQKLFDNQNLDGNKRNGFLDEILWGADFSRRMVADDGSARGPLTSGWGYFGAAAYETDNIPGTGDERILKDRVSGGNSSYQTAAMAKVASLIKDNEQYIETAERGLNWALQNDKGGPLLLSAAVDLYVATHDQKYSKLADSLFDKYGLEDINIAIEFDDVFKQDHSQQIKEKLTKEAEQMLELADNPFGIYTCGPKENPNFFGTPEKGWKFALGSNSYLLKAAEKMALAYLYQPDPRYLKFIYDQYNWILGNNPYDISMMEGIGSRFAPSYHHRYVLGGVKRGAVPGGIVNGIVWRNIGDDRPFFDMSGKDIPYYASNEFWLPHNTNYLKALVRLQEINQLREK